MRRPFTAFASLVLAMALIVLALDSATARAATVQARPKATTKVVVAPIDIWKAAAAQTPGGPLDYCAVTAFVVFPEIDGYEASRADYTLNWTGVPSATSYVLAEPYDDEFAWGPLRRTAPAGRHQVVLGGQPWVWQAGSPDCEAPYAKAVATYSTTATVTYEAVEDCRTAIDAFNSADRALTQAKKRLDKARTPAQVAAARSQLSSAKAKLTKAKKAYKKKC